MSNSMFDSGKGGVHISGGTFNDVGRDQHNTYNHSHGYDFRAGSSAHSHQYAPGTRVHHGATTNISHAGNLNLGTNYGSLVQNSGGTYSHPPPMGYYGGGPGPWGYPPPGMQYPHPMPPPWAQAPYTQPPTPNYGNPYPGDDGGYSYANSFQSNNPYKNQGNRNPREAPRRQETNPFLMNPDRSRSAPVSDDGLSYVVEEEEDDEPPPAPPRRNQPANNFHEGMANLHIGGDRRRESRSANGRPSPRGSPLGRTTCETIPDQDAPGFKNSAKDFGFPRR